jgi:hypothetical protein
MQKNIRFRHFESSHNQYKSGVKFHINQLFPSKFSANLYH